MSIPELIAHRGASHDAPENTLAAFRLAWEQGADGVEADFRLTGDGEIVSLHDPTTWRTANANLAVADTPLARLRELDAGSWKGEKWRGEPIPTLSEVIAIVPPGKRLFIELKSGPEILLPLAAVLAESSLDPDRAVILSFSTELVTEARRLLPQVKALWITRFKRRPGGWAPSLTEVLATLAQSGADGLAGQARGAVDAPLVRALRTAGRELHVWTVNDISSAARLCDLGVDSIVTDRPGWLRAGLQAGEASGRAGKKGNSASPLDE